MPPTMRRARHIIVALVIFAGLSGAALYLNFRAAGLVSRAIASAIGQPVNVFAVGFTPDAGLTLYGVEIENPPGYKSPRLLKINSLNIKPVYREIVRGRIVIDRITVVSPSVFLEKDSSGVWNFQPILDHLKLKKKKPGAKYSVAGIRLRDGRLGLTSQNLALLVPGATITGVSTINPGPLGFEFEAEDGKGTMLSGNGEAAPFASPVTLKAKLAFKGERFYAYFKPPKGLDLKDALLKAGLDVDYNGARLVAGLDGTVSGVRSAYYKGKEPLAAHLKSELEYSPGMDELLIRRAALDVTGVARVDLSGRVRGIRKDMDSDITVRLSPIELSKAAPYLPKDMRLSGILRPDAVNIRGTLRPVRLDAKGGLQIISAAVAYNGVSVNDINGSVTGSIDGRDLRAAYQVRAASAGYEKSGLSAGLLTLDGEAEVAGKTVCVKGSLAVDKAEVKGFAVQGIRAGYEYSDNTLSLRDIAFKGKDLAVSAGALDIKYAGTGMDAVLSGGGVTYRETTLNGISARASAELDENKRFTGAKGRLITGPDTLYGLSATISNAEWTYAGDVFGIEAGGTVEGSRFAVSGGATISGGQGLKNPYISGNLIGVRLANLNKLYVRSDSPVTVTDGTADISVSFKGNTVEDAGGSASIKLSGLGLDKKGKPLLKGLSGELHPAYADKAVTIPATTINFGGSFKAGVSGHAVKQDKGWLADASFELPETDLASIQEGVLDALPPAIKWADVSGRAGLKVDVRLSADGTGRVTGGLNLKGAGLDLPDMGLSAGPADGEVPIQYIFGGKPGGAAVRPFRQEDFDKEYYGALLSKYSARPSGAGLKIRKVSYGLIELDDISVGLVPGDGYYEINWFGLSGFGGRGYGYGLADFSGKEGRYALSLVVSDFSLAELCRRVPSIKGYLSGRVDGLMRVQVTGKGYEGVAGAAMFWAKDTPDEKRKISKEFLQKLVGKKLKQFMFIGDRSFDTGELDVIFSGGDMVFDELVLSHKNFLGMQDLMVSVAPVSNKISIEHLLEVIRDVKERSGTVQ